MEINKFNRLVNREMAEGNLSLKEPDERILKERKDHSYTTRLLENTMIKVLQKKILV